MKTTKVYRVLHGFSRNEMKSLAKFLQSPLFCPNEEVRVLFAFLRECIEMGIQPSKALAMKRVFGREDERDDQNFRLYCSYLYKATEKFLVSRAALEDDYYTNLTLANEFRQRSLPAFFRRQMKKTEKLLDKSPTVNHRYFDNKLSWLIQQYEFNSENQRTVDFHLQEISNLIDVVYLSGKLRQVCHLVSHQTVYTKEYDLGLLDTLLKEMDFSPYLSIPAVGVYYYGFLCLTDHPNDENFQALKKLLIASIQKFPRSELRDLFLIALNYCIRKVNEGSQSFAREALTLYQLGLEKDLLVENNRISRFTYDNIVGMSLKLGEFEWALSFIENYQSYLEPPYNKSNYHFNRARIAYEMKDYPLAIELLQRSDYEDVLNNIISKIILMKIYYETREIDSLSYHLDSMLAFLRRKNFISQWQKNYLDIVKYTKRLMSATPGDRDFLNSLEKQVEKTSFLTEKSWLLEQIRKKKKQSRAVH